MDILELNFEKVWRGGERQTLYNMQGFRSAGVNVHLICRKGFPLEEKALKDGFVVHPFKSVFGVVFFLLTKGRRYKIIHAQTSHILTYCTFTKIFHGAKVIFARRVNFTPKGFFTKQKYLLTDKIVAISNSVKEVVMKFSGRTDVSVISDIVVETELDKERAKKTIASLTITGKYIIATTAALTYEKAPLTMVEAINQLKQIRSDFVFLHFGTGDLEDIVKQKIEAYGLESVYFLMGHKEKVEDFFSVFDAFTMSSEQEGLGSSVLDAFIYKVPVVSTNAGGLNDLLKEGRGILCDIKNPQMIADGINSLLENPERKQAIVDNAFDYVVQYHSMEYITNQYIQLIENIS